MEIKEDIDLKLAKAKLKLMLDEDKRRTLGEKNSSSSEGDVKVRNLAS